MEDSEFYEVIDAYLMGEANSWQEFFLEDYFDSFAHCIDILDSYCEADVKELHDRIWDKIEGNINSKS